MIHVHRDGFVAEVAGEARLPVVLEAQRGAAGRRGVERRIGHRADMGADRFDDVEERLDHLLALVEWTGPARHRETDVLEMPFLGQERERRREMEADEAAQLLGGLSDVLAVEAQHFVGPVDRIRDRTAIDVRDRVQSVLERGDDTEVAATSPQGPEQIFVLVLAGGHHLSIGGDDFSGHRGCRTTVRTCATDIRCHHRGSTRRSRSSR